MNPIYINRLGNVSIQPTYEKDYFLESVRDYDTNVVYSLEPDYKQLIPPMQLRRMGKSIKMSSYAAKKAMEEAGVSSLDAIITGTGLGCQKDSEKFLEAILEDESSSLNPTPFIQSTHNMAAAAVALSIGCKNYNMTYVDGSTSFDSALFDAWLYINERKNQTVLVGGVDENSGKFNSFFDRINLLKKESPGLHQLLKSETEGTVLSEGASFFVVSDIPLPTTYAKVIAVEKQFKPESPETFIQSFLSKNQLSVSDMDAVFLGYNGNVKDNSSYEAVANGIFKEIQQLSYKNVFGENDTSSAYAVWLAAKTLRKQQIPEILKLNNKNNHKLENVLIYHQLEGKNHSLILLSR